VINIYKREKYAIIITSIIWFIFLITLYLYETAETVLGCSLAYILCIIFWLSYQKTEDD
jgi:uncharacterized membrane protein YjgN (DUF898 family)